MAYNPGSSIAFKSYALANIGTASTHYLGGFYTYAAAASTLTIGGTVTQTFGAADRVVGAHAFIVASEAPETDLVLTVSGVSITDAGVKNDADTEVVVADTGVVSTDQYMETTKKWLGQVTYTLTGSSGSFLFNYGFAKYEDFGNRDFTVTDFELIGHGGAGETALDIQLLLHSSAGWTYSAGAFVAGGTVIIDSSTDMGTNDNLANNVDFAYKRASLSQAVMGNASEGLVIAVTTATNSSISYATGHIGVTF